MSTVINTNLASLFAQNSLSNAQNNLATSVQRLSSGLRINSAKDDAAGLAISQNMQGQINGINQSIRNLSDATNLLQTADSSLSTIQDMLLRMKQLTVQGYDGSISATQKVAIKNEINDLNSEINATAKRTAFNGVSLLAGDSNVDNRRGDVRVGAFLTNAPVAIDAAGTLATREGDLAATDAATSAVHYQITLAPDDQNRNMPGTYTFSAQGDSVVVSANINGVDKQQTVKINAAASESGADHVTPQTLNFDQLGISVAITTTVAAGNPSVLASQIAAAFDTQTVVLTGEASKITAVRSNGTTTGPITFTSDAAGTLTANQTDGTGAIIKSEAVKVLDTDPNLQQGHTLTLDFKAFGISLDIYHFQNRSATIGTNVSPDGVNHLIDEIANLNNNGYISNLNNANINGGQTTGELSIIGSSTGGVLSFQSGATSESFIDITTLNVMTGSAGSAAGSNDKMLALGSVINGSGAGNLADLHDATGDWQTAFKNLETAVDNALEYVSSERAIFGSQMNRISYISQNLQAQSTNTQNSRSAIIDTDFASETAKLTKGQIMQQVKCQT